MTMSDCLYDGESPALPSPTSMPPSPELYLPSSPDHLQPRTTTKSSAKKSTSKYIPHSEKPPQLVERRNARERRRVESVNSAFVRLRRIVPYENRHKRLSKAKTLRTAINYISHLKQLIDQYDMQQQQQQPQHPHHQNGMMLPCAQSAYYPAYMKDLEGPSLGMPCTERQMDSIERQTQGCPDEHTLAWLRQQRQQSSMLPSPESWDARNDCALDPWRKQNISPHTSYHDSHVTRPTHHHVMQTHAMTY